MSGEVIRMSYPFGYARWQDYFKRMAERVGFEPTVARRTTTVFETAPIGRSGTSPMGQIITESRPIAYSRDSRAANPA